MQISYYELKNIINSENYTKSRKLIQLQELQYTTEIQESVYTRMLAEILDGQTEEEVLAKFEDEDNIHWINFYANQVAADLLTLGKVQPETMLTISLLPIEDFQEIVKLASTRANKLNTVTIEVERRIRLDTIPTEIV